VIWDCSDASLLLSGESVFTDIRAPEISEDMLVRHVTLRNTTGISAAFSAADFLAIISHTSGKQESPEYANLGPYAVWMHCPVSEKDGIVEVWAIYPPHQNLRMRSLVVRQNILESALG
jgi:hypothetical protein